MPDHDSHPPDPLGAVSPAPGQVPRPPRKSRSPVSERARKAAIDAFTNAHLMLFGSASGGNEWNITVSANPGEWTYHATQSAIENHGPPTPLQVLGRDKCPADRNIVTLTHVTVTACISPHWAKEFPAQGWEAAVLKAEERMIVLGAEPVSPCEPADATWRLRAIRHINDERKYCGRPMTRYCLALGHHAVISLFPDDTPELVEHIRKVATQRMEGPPNLSSSPFSYVFADEVSAFEQIETRIAPRIRKPGPTLT